MAPAAGGLRLGVPGLADCCGRGLPAAVAAQVAAAMAAARIPGPPEGVGVVLAAPVIIEHGSEDLKRRSCAPR